MKSHFSLLQTTEPPWVLLDVPSSEDLKLLPEWLYLEPAGSTAVRKLRGPKMRTRQGLMDELGAALQFFEGFGENWHALKDCLFSLDDWLPANVYLLVVTGSEQVLADESAELRWLLATLNETGGWWAKPIVDNGSYNRPAIPFHTVFQVESTKVERLPPELASLPRLRGI